METFPSWLWWWTALCGIIGGAVGSKKGRLILGFIFGFLAGPIGIGIILLLKGNRRACPHCLERIHKDASVCQHCQREIIQSPYFDSLDDHRRTQTGIIAAILVILVIVAGIVLLLINSNALNSTKSNASTKPQSSARAAIDIKPQARRRITRKQFDQLRENMLYSTIVMILGFEGEMVSETKIPDRLGSDVLYRWVNPDGSIVMVTFRRLDMSKDRVPDVLMSETISSVGLAN
jgi:predicted nucleic acid-binding Zn ribbon protein